MNIITLFRKGSSITIIGLFFVINFTSLAGSIDNFDQNMELDYRVSNNLSGYGTVCGFITDNQTNLPIENAKVDIQRYSKYWNHTYTNSSGFYTICVKSGAYIRIYPHADNYCSKYHGNKWLKENETIWINASLLPRPPENSNIFGYVSDKNTSEPMEDVKIILGWRDENWNRYSNETHTNSSGFYNFNVAAGTLTLSLDVEGYYHEGWHGNIGENKTKQKNFSMHPVKPKNSFVCGYITDAKTGKPIEGANVYLHWQDAYGHSLHFDNRTNPQGFYNIDVAEGIVSIRSIIKKGYWTGCTPYYNIGKNEALWLNKTLEPLPPENSIICGYVTEVETANPLEGAKINLKWEENINWNSTKTNNSGFYIMNIAAGKFKLDVSLEGYLREKSSYYTIGENETLWINFSMYPIPPLNSFLEGYVTDNETHEPIKDVYVDAIWEDEYGHKMWFSSITNKKGYYHTKTAAGKIYIDAWENYNYYEFISDIFYIEENESRWFNFSMVPYNYPPFSPTITGKTSGDVGEEYNYTFVAIDPEGDNLFYDIYWGENIYIKGFGPYASGEEVNLSYSWRRQGKYTIQSRAVDEHGNVGDWGFLEVTMPKAQNVYLGWLERFPRLFRLLDNLGLWR